MENRFNQGVLCISLDFELHWGTFETVKLDEKGRKRFQQTRDTIPALLNLFGQYNVAATWATVGMLFNRNAHEWHDSKPEVLPEYCNKNVSSYDWIDKNAFNSNNEQFYFAPELVELISSYERMELASHTYSHYYCREKGQQIDSFESDMKMAQLKANQRGFSLTSLVFPRNQFNAEYLEVCQKLGITCVRSNPDIWFWGASASDHVLKKIIRAADHFIRIDADTDIPLQSLNPNQTPLQVPASRFLRPWHPNKILNKLKLKRIKNEMTRAAQRKALYHLWWHPHNFGNHPNQCMADLQELLEHFRFLENEYGMLSLHMQGLRQHIVELNQ